MNRTSLHLVAATLTLALTACCPLAGEVVVQDSDQALAVDWWPPGLETATPGAPVLGAEGWEPLVWDKLSAFVRATGRPDLPVDQRPVAIFDFDNTCLRNDLGRAVFFEAVENLAFRFDAGFWDTIPEDLGRDELRRAVERVLERVGKSGGEKLRSDADFLFWRKNIARAYQTIWQREPGQVAAAWLVSTFVGMSPAEIRALTRQTLARQLTAPLEERALVEDPGDESPVFLEQGLRFYDEIRDLIGALQRHGFDVWIVSASSQWTVEVGAAYVGVPIDHVVGVRVARDAEGRLTTQAEPPVTHGPGKVAAIRKFTRRTPTLVLGDSMTDREMLSAAAGMAILIDKGEEELRALARQEGWLVQPRFAVQ